MGDLRPDNVPPDDGGTPPRGLPDLPAEWGTIVIPDDPAELAAEADALRRELRTSNRRARIRRALGRRSGRSSSLGIPVVIMTVAIITTMVSLLVVTWGTIPTTKPPAVGPSATSKNSTPAATSPSPDLHTPLSSLTFNRPGGTPVRLGDLTPMVLLLVDGCNCQQLVTDVAGAVHSGVKVVPVASTATATPSDPANVVRLADPAGTLRARYAGRTPDGTAGAVVVDSKGTVLATVPHATKVGDIKPLDPP